ncbi:hypothetical protein GQ53DRAFT_828721 [Thozetella sp. PMI_491]|nr:hypothetical protein GQ53DRAFT_828721 [Thozetella sp. PMI_491]
MPLLVEPSNASFLGCNTHNTGSNYLHDPLLSGSSAATVDKRWLNGLVTFCVSFLGTCSSPLYSSLHALRIAIATFAFSFCISAEVKVLCLRSLVSLCSDVPLRHLHGDVDVFRYIPPQPPRASNACHTKSHGTLSLCERPIAADSDMSYCRSIPIDTGVGTIDLDPSCANIRTVGDHKSSRTDKSRHSGAYTSSSGSAKKSAQAFNSAQTGAREHGDNEDEDGEDKYDPLESHVGEPSSPSGRRLACPFYKYNPRQFAKVRTCPGPGFKDMSRLKEHLKRSHHDIPKEILQKIQSRQQIQGTNEEKWYYLYKLLFGGQLPESPYYDALMPEGMNTSSHPFPVSTEGMNTSGQQFLPSAEWQTKVAQDLRSVFSDALGADHELLVDNLVTNVLGLVIAGYQQVTEAALQAASQPEYPDDPEWPGHSNLPPFDGPYMPTSAPDYWHGTHAGITPDLNYPSMAQEIEPNISPEDYNDNMQIDPNLR